MITVATIQSEMASLLKNRGISSQVYTWIYLALEEILSSHDYWWNKKKTSLATVSGTSEYILDHRVQGKQILWFGDEDRTDVEITEVPLESIYGFDPTPTDSGSPEHWAYVNQSNVTAVTTAAGTISVSSSSASDNAATLVARGRVSGVERVETYALNGTSTVTGTLSFAADGIEALNLSAACVGTVTVTHGGTTIASIPPGYLRIEAPRIRLWRVPSSVLTLPYVFYQRPIKPNAATDIVDIPNFAFDCLLCGVEHYGHRNNGDYELAYNVKQIFRKEIDNLWVKSRRDVNQTNQKDFAGGRSSKLMFSLPKTVTYTVT